MTTGAELLSGAFAASCQSLQRVLAEIGDEEFFWEPVPGCRTVHRRSEVRAASADGSGEWVIGYDYEVPEPQPAPVTTIAWRTVHIAAVNYLYWDYAFGAGTLSCVLEIPGSAAGALGWLTDSQQPLTEVLAGLSDADLDRPRQTNWGEVWPCHRIFATLVNEQVHHGAEISLLRDLFRSRGSLSQVPG